MRSVSYFALIPALLFGLLVSFISPVKAAVDIDPALLPERSQLVRDALFLGRDLAVLQERLSEAGSRSLNLYLNLDARSVERFQSLVVRLNGRVIVEQPLSLRSSGSNGLKRVRSVTVSSGDYKLEARLIAADGKFSETIKFTKGSGRDHIKITVFQEGSKSKKKPEINLAHEPWGELK